MENMDLKEKSALLFVGNKFCSTNLLIKYTCEFLEMHEIKDSLAYFVGILMIWSYNFETKSKD